MTSILKAQRRSLANGDFKYESMRVYTFQGTIDLGKPIDITKSSALYIVGTVRTRSYLYRCNMMKDLQLDLQGTMSRTRRYRKITRLTTSGGMHSGNGGDEPAVLRHTVARHHVNRGNKEQKMPHAEKRIDNPSIPSSNISA